MPDVVVLSNTFWDIARWVRWQPEVLAVGQSTDEDAFRPQLELWQHNFIRLLKLVKVTCALLAIILRVCLLNCDMSMSFRRVFPRQQPRSTTQPRSLNVQGAGVPHTHKASSVITSMYSS